MTQKSSADILGGFVLWRIEEFPQPMLIGNHQGGYRVQCPRCREPVARNFSNAVQEWRKGGGFNLKCPQCCSITPLDEVLCIPEIAFTRAMLVLCDVGHTDLSKIKTDLDNHLEAYKVVFKRMG